MVPINKRKIGFCVFLSLITLGAYFVYWEYLLVKNVKALKCDNSRCTGEMLCLVFVPFYPIYWWYTRGKTVRSEFSRLKCTASGNETTYLILAIFGLGIISTAIMQNDFNSLPAETVKPVTRDESVRAVIGKILPPVVAVFLVFGLWIFICEQGSVPKAMLPSPGDVWKAFCKDWPLMMKHARVTLTETFIGLFVGILIGFFSAVIMDRFRIVKKMIYPLIIISQTIPTVAIAPLLVLWLGYQMLPKIVLIVLIVFFPISISLLQGFASAEQIFRYVKVPGALGHFFSSLKISVSYAVVGAVLAEWLGGTEGLGCYLTRVRKAFSYDKMFAVIILISVISLFLIWLTGFIQKKCMPWDRINKKRS